MNDKHEKHFNNKIISFNKNQSFRQFFMEKENKKLNEEIDFRRTTSACILNTEGDKPLILYLKTPKKNRFLLENKKFGSHFNIPNYISDGGLNQKSKKFLNLLLAYPVKYKYYSPLKHKKEILNELKNKNYKCRSLSFSYKKLYKNRTEIQYNKYNEISHLFDKSSKKKSNKNLFNNIGKIKKDNKSKKEINSYNDHYKTKKFYLKNVIKNLLNNKNINNITLKEKKANLIFIERKKQLLKRNGVDILKIDVPNGEEKKNEYKEINNNKNSEIKTIFNKNNNYKEKINYFQNEEENKKRNQFVDQFEYIKKIINEQKKIHKSKLKLNNFIKINKFILSNNLNEFNINRDNKNNINKKDNILNKEIRINNNKREKAKIEDSNGETYDEYPYSHKKSHRDIEELKKYNKQKRLKQKNKSKEKEKEKKRKILKRFHNLYKLNLEKINSERLFNNKTKTKKGDNDIIKKRKVINTYYIGNEFNKSTSTLIEPNDYYFSLYESKRVITNSNIDISNKILELPTTILNLKNNINNKKTIFYNHKTISKLILIIKSIFTKKPLAKLHNNYNRIKYYYNYYLAINFFIAIIKHYPFKKIYLYKLNEKEACISGNKILEQKCIFFVKILSLFFKIKIFEKIFNYTTNLEREFIKEKISKMFIIILKSYLKHFFKILKEKKLNNDRNIFNKKSNIKDNDLEEEEKNSSLFTNKEMKKTLLKEENIIKIKKENINSDEENKIMKKNERNFELKKDDDDKIGRIKYNFRYDDNNDNKNDISAERDNEQDIHWEFNCSNDKIKKQRENKNVIKNNNINNQKSNKDDDEYSGDFQDIKSNSEYSDICNLAKLSNEKNKNVDSKKINKESITKNAINYKNKEIYNNINIESIKENENINQSSKSKKIENIYKLADDLTEEIIKIICNEEILSSKIKLIPNKSFKNEFNNDYSIINNVKNEIVSKELNFLEINNLDLALKENDKLSLDNSLYFSSSTYSIFNKNIKDKKIQHSINLYMEKIFPKLIKLIQKELVQNHKRIYDNISTPFTNNSKNIMISISLKDKKMLEENYKLKIFKEKLEDIIDKKNILKKFDKINNEIRIEDNISSDNYYDRILNECIIDTVIELINKERINYFKGEPLLWDSRKIELINKYDIRNNPKKFSLFICKSLIDLLNTKLGILSDKYNTVNLEKINKNDEMKLNNMMKEEIIEISNEWENLEIEETKAKLDASDYIFEMLIRENIEILEHIQNNRKRPDLYNYKSIYACSDMPKLEFQKTENKYIDDSENDFINM